MAVFEQSKDLTNNKIITNNYIGSHGEDVYRKMAVETAVYEERSGDIR